MMPLDAYKTYLALKNHFTRPDYDYHKYRGKVRANLQSFYKRKDRFWFEKLARNKSDKEIVDFFIANFAGVDDPQSMWIGEIIREGDSCYKEWMKRQQSLSYIFKQESEDMLSESNLEQVLDASKQHPIILKKFLSGKISIETLTIWDKIFLFGNKFDKQLLDPVWETVSFKIKKYSPFIHIDVLNYKNILKEIVLGEK